MLGLGGSGDKAFQIFVSPTINDSIRALDVLTHEICHTVVGIEAKHNGKFARLARKVGLEGKPTSTEAGEELREFLGGIVVRIGEYPQPEFTPTKMPKKQTTRQLKVECPECGYIARVSRGWLDTGAPICPTDRVSMEEA